ncbi:hypothetical protein OXYTRIMIC_249 [Oxytricha trifallax]|uniref:Uncharacterized protein n=1 Tax=Oxytricha trifallax TaxID=1172189 RepID=A0A073I086_9SPIT|nr:hypothetical protein OXYTRIMIC_249 [Oxytricha trifallax]
MNSEEYAQCQRCKKDLTGSWQSEQKSTPSKLSTGIKKGFFLGENSNEISSYCRECFNKEIMNLSVVKNLLIKQEEEKLFQQPKQDELIHQRAKELIANELEKVFAWTPTIEAVDYHIEFIEMSKKNKVREDFTQRLKELRQFIQLLGTETYVKFSEVGKLEQRLSDLKFGDKPNKEFTKLDGDGQIRLQPVINYFIEEKLQYLLEQSKNNLQKHEQFFQEFQQEFNSKSKNEQVKFKNHYKTNESLNKKAKKYLEELMNDINQQLFNLVNNVKPEREAKIFFR